MAVESRLNNNVKEELQNVADRKSECVELNYQSGLIYIKGQMTLLRAIKSTCLTQRKFNSGNRLPSFTD